MTLRFSLNYKYQHEVASSWGPAFITMLYRPTHAAILRLPVCLVQRKRRTSVGPVFEVDGLKIPVTYLRWHLLFCYKCVRRLSNSATACWTAWLHKARPHIKRRDGKDMGPRVVSIYVRCGHASVPDTLVVSLHHAGARASCCE